jgi:ABC-type iron transport system FetAB ATPase subunit
LAEAPAIPRLRLCGLRSAHAGPFDLTLAGGEAVAIQGASGSGKSLLLRMIADLDPNVGEVWLDGVARASMSGPQWRARVRYCAAESGWWAESVAAHFAAPDTIAPLAARLGLPEAVMGMTVLQLSSGERQRLALLRALGDRPAVLLLDEPTAALDPGSVARVEALLDEHRRAGMALLIATHDPAQPQRLGARVLRMVDRRLCMPTASAVPA